MTLLEALLDAPHYLSTPVLTTKTFSRLPGSSASSVGSKSLSRLPGSSASAGSLISPAATLVASIASRRPLAKLDRDLERQQNQQKDFGITLAKVTGTLTQHESLVESPVRPASEPQRKRVVPVPSIERLCVESTAATAARTASRAAELIESGSSTPSIQLKLGARLQLAASPSPDLTPDLKSRRSKAKLPALLSTPQKVKPAVESSPMPPAAPHPFKLLALSRSASSSVSRADLPRPELPSLGMASGPPAKCATVATIKGAYGAAATVPFLY